MKIAMAMFPAMSVAVAAMAAPVRPERLMKTAPSPAFDERRCDQQQRGHALMPGHCHDLKLGAGGGREDLAEKQDAHGRYARHIGVAEP